MGSSIALGEFFDDIHAGHKEENTRSRQKEEKSIFELRQEIMADGGISFTAFIPESVVALMSAHGQTCGVKIYDNGCAGVPWCGEAPC